MAGVRESDMIEVEVCSHWPKDSQFVTETSAILNPLASVNEPQSCPTLHCTFEGALEE